MVEPLLETVLILLAVGTLAVALCRQLGLSPVLGYLAAGILSGPHALGLLPDSAETRFLAELGVVLLMFTIGLEFSVSRLLALKRLVLGLGGAQVALTALALGAAAWWWLDEVPGTGALAIGAALAMSSTAIVLKQLGEQLELAAPHGRLAVAVLLFQDLAAVGVLAALPALTGATSAATGELILRVLVAAATLAAMVVLGRRLLPALLQWVAATRSLELFMLTTLLLALAAALVSELVGLSPALGAFMAGMETALEARLADEGAGLSGHVLICGYGNRGQNLAAVLAREGTSSLALDLDPERVRQARSAGATVAYGDCTRPGVLRAAGLDRAAALAVTFRGAERIVPTLTQLRRQGGLPPVLVRKTGGASTDALRAAGAEVFPEDLESGLQFAEQLLLLLGLPHSRVEAAVDHLRRENYAPLRAVFADSGGEIGWPRAVPDRAGEAEPRIYAVTLSRNSSAVGQTPDQLDLAAAGVELLDVRRGGLRVPGPLLDTELRARDVLVLKGPGSAVEHALARVLDNVHRIL